MKIKVLGGGCFSCKKLLSLTKDAIKELGIEADVVYVTDMEQIMKTGIMQTPALMIDGVVKVSGRVPKRKEIKKIIEG